MKEATRQALVEFCEKNAKKIMGLSDREKVIAMGNLNTCVLSPCRLPVIILNGMTKTEFDKYTIKSFMFNSPLHIKYALDWVKRWTGTM